MDKHKNKALSKVSESITKPENLKDVQGNIMRCVSCQSIRHLLSTCLDSYENIELERAKKQEMQNELKKAKKQELKNEDR